MNRCVGCPYYRLEISRPDLLHRTLAEILIAKEARLVGREMRFLRRCLRLSETDLARRMGVTIETVSRWEHDTRSFKGPADRLLRLLAAVELGARCPPLDRLGLGMAEETTARVAFRSGAWVAVE